MCVVCFAWFTLDRCVLSVLPDLLLDRCVLPMLPDSLLDRCVLSVLPDSLLDRCDPLTAVCCLIHSLTGVCNLCCLIHSLIAVCCLIHSLTGAWCVWTAGPSTSPPPCVDVLDNCDSYEASSCTDPVYGSWAKANCRRTCRLCPGQSTLDTLTILNSITTAASVPVSPH